MKARTKARKLADKRGRSVRTMQRQWEAQEAMPVKAHEDPRTVVLSARCRFLGRADTKTNRLALSDQMAGDPAGQAIILRYDDPDTRKRLWDVFKRYDGAHAAYHRRIIGRPRFPNVAKIEFMPERFETSADDDIDTRTPDEKDRDAVNGWRAWMSITYKLTVHQRMALMDGLWLRGPFLREGSLTTVGREFAEAVFVLADVEQGA